MINSYHYLTGQTAGVTTAMNWGDSWVSCITEYIKFQQLADFPEAGPSLPSFTGVRPIEISIWMKNGRPNRGIDIADSDKFSQRWQAWWLRLQPKNREPGSIPSSDMDWSQLRKPGKNGFLLIMVTLLWWGMSLDEGHHQDGQWMDIVTDVTAVLSCLNSTVEPFADAARPKRGVQDADKNVAGPSRKRRKA